MAVIHIIPGVIISLFNKNNSRKISIYYKILVWAGLIATFTTIPLRNIHSIREVGYPKTDYLSLFTRGYIEKVNEYYCKDFEFCGYEMWDPLGFPEN